MPRLPATGLRSCWAVVMETAGLLLLGKEAISPKRGQPVGQGLLCLPLGLPLPGSRPALLSQSPCGLGLSLPWPWYDGAMQSCVLGGRWGLPAPVRKWADCQAPVLGHRRAWAEGCVSWCVGPISNLLSGLLSSRRSPMALLLQALAGPFLTWFWIEYDSALKRSTSRTVLFSAGTGDRNKVTACLE